MDSTGIRCCPRLSSLCVRSVIENASHPAVASRIRDPSTPQLIRQLIMDQAAEYDMLTPDAVKSFFVSRNTQYLNLSATSLTDAVVSSFASSKGNVASAVSHLDLSKTPAVRTRAWKTLARSLADSLSNINVSSSVSKGLLASFSSCSNLRVVRADGCQTVQDEDVINILSRCPLLQEVTLRRCSQLTNKAIVRGLPQRSYILRLDLRDCRKLGDPALEAIADRCPTLLSLALEGQRFNTGLTSVLNKCSELKSLAIPMCQLADQESLLFIRNTNCRVRDLDLFGALFSEATLLYIFGNVFRNLRKLNISGVRHLTLNVFKYICRRSPSLHELSLKGHLSNVTDEYLLEIGERLFQLDSIDLGLCRALTSGGIRRLMETLPTSLRQVGLVSLPVLEDNVVALIAERFGSSLEKISVGGCSLVCDTSLAILGEKCTRLRSLCLKGTNILSPNLLKTLLARNLNLQSLSLSGVKAVNDSVLNTLDGCSELSAVYMSGVSLSEAGENAYRKSHPRVQLYGKRCRHPL